MNQTTMTSKSINAVIFDWAGTIVDYGSRAPALAFVELFLQRGVSLTMKEARGPMGLDKRKHIEELCKLEAIQSQWLQRYGRLPEQKDINELYEEFLPIQLRTIQDCSKLIPGVLEVISTLRSRGIRIGTTTGYNSKFIEEVNRLSRQQGLYVDAIVCSSDVDQGRPYPWMAWECAKRLGVFPPNSIVKVGDTIVDIEEGINAGMWSIGVTFTGNEFGLSERELLALDRQERDLLESSAKNRMLQAGAHGVIRSIQELPMEIKRIEGLIKT